jgi:hypothetical protein
MIICSTGRVLAYSPNATQDIKRAEPKSPQSTPDLVVFSLATLSTDYRCVLYERAVTSTLNGKS